MHFFYKCVQICCTVQQIDLNFCVLSFKPQIQKACEWIYKLFKLNITFSSVLNFYDVRVEAKLGWRTSVMLQHLPTCISTVKFLHFSGLWIGSPRFASCRGCSEMKHQLLSPNLLTLPAVHFPAFPNRFLAFKSAALIQLHFNFDPGLFPCASSYLIGLFNHRKHICLLNVSILSGRTFNPIGTDSSL